MIEILALTGFFVILWWVSKALKRMSIGLANASVVIVDLVAYCSKKPENNNRVPQQNIMAEEKLHNITGENSNVSYNKKVLDEIEGIIQDLNPRTPR
jgi:hypothetical protein